MLTYVGMVIIPLPRLTKLEVCLRRLEEAGYQLQYSE